MKSQHYGFVSSINENNLEPWYKTQVENEVISFTKDGTTVTLNAITIYANKRGIYVKMDDDTDVLYISPGTFRTYEYESLNQITILGLAGQDIRWEGMIV